MTKDVFKSYSEGLELLRHTSVVIEGEYTKRYHNSLPVLMQLTRAENIFLYFITEEMDDDNYISNTIQIRDRFNALLTKIGQPTYSETTIHRCFANLTKRCLLVQQKGRGLYQVSPVFFFKGSEEQRAKVLRKQLEYINKEPINKYRRGLLIGIDTFSTQEQEEN